MPSRMKFRATKLRTPSHCVVCPFACCKSSNENVLGSDFTSQYRRSPGARGTKTCAHAPPSCFAGDFLAFAAGFLAAAAAFFGGPGFAALLAACFFVVPAAFFAPVRFPRLDELISHS